MRASEQLVCSEPSDWLYPVLHFQGAALLDAGQYKAAKAIHREDPRRDPGNGWVLFGLAQALKGQGRTAGASAVNQRFKTAWAGSDFALTRTAF